MLRVIPVSLFLTLLWGAGDLRQVRYYLSEHDFLSDHPVPVSEVRGVPHIQAEYDVRKHLLKRVYKNELGQVLSWEEFIYADSVGELRSKREYDSSDLLTREWIYGPEEKSYDYIEYVYGVDSVQSWGDRFTSIRYRPDLQTRNYRFFDVDAFEYGSIQFHYDSSGHLSSELWIRRPSDRIVRKWDHQFDPLSGITRITEFDSNGVVVQDVNLSADGSEAIFWFTGPEDNAVINHSRLSFRLDKDLEDGNLTWNRLGAASEYVDSIRVELEGQYMGSGDHTEVDFKLDSLLVNGAKYRIVFRGEGHSGYRATERVLGPITFDQSPPDLSLQVKSHIRIPSITFQTSEPLREAILAWIPDSAHTYRDSIHRITLTEEELKMGGQKSFRPVNQDVLVDSVVYWVSITGKDLAGNQGPTVQRGPVHYDVSKPILKLMEPAAESYFNHQKLSVTVSESLMTAAVQYRSMGGKTDLKAPHRISLPQGILSKGDHDLDLSGELELTNGTVYGIDIFAQDPAGNQSDTATVQPLYFDDTPPVLTMIYPFDDAAIRETAVSFVFDENLQAAEFRWEWQEGTVDTSAPHIIALVNDELTQEEKIKITPVNQTPLADGAVYTLTLVGRDLAGNTGNPVIVRNILYDAIPPEFSDLEPSSDLAVNTMLISYTLSENLTTGFVTYKWVGGVRDPNAPFAVELVDTELIGGEHKSIALINMYNLSDGTIYDIEFNGSDRAGNEAASRTIANILYDITAPEVTIAQPQSYSVLPHMKLDYSISENLDEGTFTWQRTGGMEDSLAPYQINLTREERQAGEYPDYDFSSRLHLVEGTIYSLFVEGVDRAGNKTPPIQLSGLSYDFTPPEVMLVAPINRSAVNHTQVRYSLSESLGEGAITWQWIKGNSDPVGTHTQSLQAGELDPGDHGDIMLVNSPNLVDGAWYTLDLHGKDHAGNPSNRSIVMEVLYDITVPSISITTPENFAFVPTSSITYSLSESLETGRIIYTQTSGSADENSPHVVELDLEARMEGDGKIFHLPEGKQLVEGGVYSIQFEGEDRAGNTASIAQVQGMIYDATPPSLTLSYPEIGSSVNSVRVSFSNSEPLLSAQFTWIRTGGEEDPGSPHIAELAGGELEKRQYEQIELVNSPSLIDGCIYSLELIGKDPAGNSSEPVVVNNVRYDITPPTIMILEPVDRAHTYQTGLIYTLSEDLDQGRILWSSVDASGNKGEITHSLEIENRSSGQHQSNSFFVPDLVDGGVYSISVEGTDAAGNNAVPAQVNEIHFDQTPPVFSELNLESDTMVNSDWIGYSLSENLQFGRFEFVAAGGAPDPVNIHSIELVESERAEGSHGPFRLSQQTPLQDGTVYRVRMFGSDQAGNRSDTLVIDNITYDITAPEITITSPADGDFILTTDVVLKLSEPLESAEIIWTTAEGDSHVFTVNPIDLIPGDRLLDAYHVDLQEDTAYLLYIRGRDFAGNLTLSDKVENLLYDGTPPEIILHAPVSGQSVNHTRLSWEVSEDLSSGTITWKADSGEDPQQLYEITLEEEERLRGRHEDTQLENAPDLSDGVIYSLVLEGVDRAGNRSKPVIIDSIHYDVTPPKFTVDAPLDSSYLNTVELLYTLSEDLTEGKIKFTQVDGVPDPRSPHTVNLQGSRLQKGTKGGELPRRLVSLVSGSQYDISFWGRDLAGNESPSNITKGIHFDNEPPFFILSSPQSNTATNSTAVSYATNEDLKSATLTYQLLTGETGSPLIIALNEQERKAGEWSDIVLKQGVTLQDGGLYKLTFTGMDHAGNEGKAFVVNKVLYDATAPELEVYFPIQGQEINIPVISYSLSEDLEEGVLEVVRLGGAPDNRSPQKVPLARDELKAGRKDSLELLNGPVLVNGTRYRYQFTGKDRAGNQISPIQVDNILFDNEPPVISITLPLDGEQIKKTSLSYMLTDDLREGSIVFKQTGGTMDPSSPHQVLLSQEERIKGMHTDIELPLMDQLADGGRYEISIDGSDGAGNKAQIVSVKDVLFDVLPPVLAILKPVEKARINKPIFSYRSSEELLMGEVTVTRVEGVADPGSPHRIQLASQNLSQGENPEFNLDLSLVDGCIYRFSLTGTDLAGNASESEEVEGVLVDRTPAGIALIEPEAGQRVQAIWPIIEIDEDLMEGFLEIYPSQGQLDPDQVQHYELQSEQLFKGRHEVQDLHQKLALKSGMAYSLKLSGKDLAGNISVPVEIDAIALDTDPPEIQVIEPGDDSSVNHTRIGLIISEDLGTARIRWERLDGNPDPGSPHDRDLPTSLMSAGTYTDVTLTDPPDLVSGTVYRIIMTGSDLAGNDSSAVTTGILYDIDPPEMQVSVPQSGEYLNHNRIDYSLNEELESGLFTWTAKGGSPDPSSPHLAQLTAEESQPGEYQERVLENAPDLIDGGLYSLRFKGTDLAGNIADILVAENITYDVTPPEFRFLSPGNDSYVQSSSAGYTLSEDIVSGKISWTHARGTADPIVRHEIQLTGDGLKFGEHEADLAADEKLVSGSTYEIAFTGVDAAGNKSPRTQVTNVTYDVTPPSISITRPELGSIVRNWEISFTLSEPLKEAQLILNQVGGVSDPGSPHNVSLTEDEFGLLKATDKVLANMPDLQDGSIYRLELMGSDLSGNVSQSEPVDSVTFDISRPLITITRPEANMVAIGDQVSYTLSEYLEKGSATWSRVGGLADPNSPHIFELTEDERKAGDYTEHQFAMAQDLSVGTVYSLTLKGSDPAGNESRPATVHGIELVRTLEGNWFFQGAIMMVVWTFETDEGGDGTAGTFAQGVQLGTKISNQDFGRFTLDYSKKPWVMEWEVESGQKRISLYEFTDRDHLKVITGTRKPKNWSDGEVMIYEFRSE